MVSFRSFLALFWHIVLSYRGVPFILLIIMIMTIMILLLLLLLIRLLIMMMMMMMIMLMMKRTVFNFILKDERIR